MKNDPNGTKKLNRETKQEAATVAQPSAELAAFLELLGRALAQEWIEHQGRKPNCP